MLVERPVYLGHRGRRQDMHAVVIPVHKISLISASMKELCKLVVAGKVNLELRRILIGQL